MLVQSHDRFDEVGDFDPQAGRLVTYSRASAPNRSGPLCGHFARLNGVPVVLYRHAAGLHISVGGEAFSLDASTRVEHHATGSEHVLRLARGDAELTTVRYEQDPLDPPLSEDPTPFVEEEDFDFGLFLANVARDPDRQRRMYQEARGD